MSKRSASSDINHDNWDQEEEPEEAGVFKTAPKSVIDKRVIRTAKRRISGSPIGRGAKNVFSGFAGFGQNKSPAPVDAKTAFSFLSNSSSSDKLLNSNSNPKEDNIIIEKDNKESVYVAKLKGLNEGFIDWIKQHVESNPCCILTPVFRDYEKYLKEIEDEKKSSSESKSNDIRFNFGTTDDSVQNKPFISNVFTLNLAGATHTLQLNSLATPLQQTTSLATPLQPPSSSATPRQQSSSLLTVPPNKTPDKKPPLSSASLVQSSSADQKSLPFFGASSNKTFSFTSGSSSTFSFGSLNSKPPSDNNQDSVKQEEENEEPPKNDFTAVKEDDAVLTQRVKVFIKKGEEFKDRGVGNLFVKETPNGKYQALVRADTNLGNILFNILLTNDVPTKRLGKNNVMCICLPTPEHPPPPVPVLLRVKTSEDADKLLEELNKYKK